MSRLINSLTALRALTVAAAVTGMAPVYAGVHSEAGGNLSLTEQQFGWIARQVFSNECNARTACLVHWNRGEDFPSLGIGHFIWYPGGETGPFVESFPELVAYIQAREGGLPAWLVSQAPVGAPWPDREAFMEAEQDDPRVEELRALLANRQYIQAAFLLKRARGALDKVVAASADPGATRRKIRALTETPGGVYALIDYVNFKGEGLAPSERYEGVGWGLLQVLETMAADPVSSQTALDAFRYAAASVLSRRAELSGRAIEQQWLPGWLNRVDTYREPEGQEPSE